MFGKRVFALGFLAAGLLGACSGPRSKAAGPASPAEPVVRPGAPGVAWSQKTHSQRLDWMGLEVLPQTMSLFQAYDPEGYSEFRCQTCHGEEMESRDFKMPNPELYALSPTSPLEEAREYDEEVTQFMADKLVPGMARLLDTHPFDPESSSGFGCFGCHPVAE